MKKCFVCDTTMGIIERKTLADGKVVCARCFNRMQIPITLFNSNSSKLNQTELNNSS